MNLITMVLAALVCLTALASAIPDGMKVGQYNVSFDLNTSNKHSISIVQHPEVMEKYGGEEFMRCSFRILSKDNKEHAASVQLTAEHESSYDELKDRLSGLPLPLDIFDRVIDEQLGVLGVGHGIGEGGNDIHIALYCLPVAPDGYNATECAITSTFPWDEGTLSLLKTIHVEMINAITE